MPGNVYKGAEVDHAAVWKDGTLYARDGLTPLLSRRPGGWALGNQSAVVWKVAGNTYVKAPSSATFCRVVQGNVLKGNAYDVLFRLVGDGILRANGREVIARGPGLTPDELVLTAAVFEKL